MRPSEYPEVGARLALRELLRVQVDMHLKTLLCLPLPERGLQSGCNLTAATLAVNIIAGASVLFWDSSPEALHDRRDRRRRFLALAQAKYPWNTTDAADAQLGSELLWDHTRNPLSPDPPIGVAGWREMGPATSLCVASGRSAGVIGGRGLFGPRGWLGSSVFRAAGIAPGRADGLLGCQ